MPKPPAREFDYSTELLASATKTSTANGAAKRLPDGIWAAIAFTLDVTAAATVAGDTLDVVIETTHDGTNYTEVAHFSQVLGTATTVREVAKIVASATQAVFDPTAALGAGAVRHVIGDQWRVKWTIAGPSPSFTFSVQALPM